MPCPTGKSFDRNTSFFDDLFDSSHLPILQADLDAVWVVRGFGKDIFDNAFRKLSCALILFQDDKYRQAGFDIGAQLTIHIVYGATVVGIGVFVTGCGVEVIVGGGNVSVGIVGIGVLVGGSVSSGRGVRLGVRVGSGVGVGRLKVRKTRFSA